MERTIELLALRIAQLEVDKAMLQEKLEKLEVINAGLREKMEVELNGNKES